MNLLLILTLLSLVFLQTLTKAIFNLISTLYFNSCLTTTTRSPAWLTSAANSVRNSWLVNLLLLGRAIYWFLPISNTWTMASCRFKFYISYLFELFLLLPKLRHQPWRRIFRHITTVVYYSVYTNTDIADSCVMSNIIFSFHSFVMSCHRFLKTSRVLLIKFKTHFMDQPACKRPR